MANQSIGATSYAPGSLAHALDISGMGEGCVGQRWAVFPVYDKVPFAGSHGFRDAATDPDEIRALFHRYAGANGVGIATGAVSGIWVLDVDIKNGHRGDDTLHELERVNGQLCPTVEVLTPTGGQHLYFLYDERVHSSAGTLGDGLDIRSDGGYVVAPGSRHNSSTVLYEWETEHQPCS
jgi:hypothetical protein